MSIARQELLNDNFEALDFTVWTQDIVKLYYTNLKVQSFV